MYYISALTNPQQKITRKATAFAGRFLNIYPWPVASMVTRVYVSGRAGNTGPLLGTVIGGYSGSPVDTPFFQPQRIALNNYISQGQYLDATGVMVLNPSNIPYLRIDFGSGSPLSATDVYIEGYQTSTSDLNHNSYSKITDTSRVITTPFNRILLGSASAITSFVKKASPFAFRQTSYVEDGSFNLGGTTHVYLASDTKFSGIQINLGSESYTRTKVYSLEYWNGSGWGSVSGTIESTTYTGDDSMLVFMQSGIIKFTPPTDWQKTIVSGDPYTTELADITTNYGTNFTYSNNQYYIRIVPPGSNSETVPVNSISLFN